MGWKIDTQPGASNLSELPTNLIIEQPPPEEAYEQAFLTPLNTPTEILPPEEIDSQGY